MSTRWLFSAIALLSHLPGTAGAQPRSGTPADIKGAYLLVIARYVTWPDSSATSPFIIGVMNADEVADSLRRQAQSRTVQGRRIEVRTVDQSPTNRVHVLFIGDTPATDPAKIAAALKSRPILTVSDREGFIHSVGAGAKGTYGQEARWCGYHGKRRLNPNVVEGLTMMTHPDNPWRPVWFTRDYGHLSPSPFNFLKEPWNLKSGSEIRLRYRFALHAGTPQEADVDSLYAAWVKG